MKIKLKAKVVTDKNANFALHNNNKAERTQRTPRKKSANGQ